MMDELKVNTCNLVDVSIRLFFLVLTPGCARPLRKVGTVNHESAERTD